MSWYPIFKTLFDPLGIGIGDAVFGANKGPDYSAYDSEQEAALAAERAAYEDFIKGGPASYSVGDALKYDNRQVGDALKYSTLDPTQVIRQGESNYGSIAADPRLVDSEINALRSLEERANEGLTLQDQADMARLQNDVSRRARGRQGAIQQDMTARGIRGSGLDLVAQMQASQDATETEALASLEKTAQAQNNKRAAAIDAGNLAGRQRGQQFNEQAAIAAARDAIARFNAGNQVDQQRLNLELQNRAADQNWNRRNSVSDQNVDTRNNVALQNWGRQNTVSDNNTSAAYNYRKDKLGAGVAGSQADYDRSVDRETRQQMQDEQARQRSSDKFGNLLGVAGGVAGGVFGGPAGAAAGYSAGKGIGGAVGNTAYDNGYGRKRRYAHGGMVDGDALVPGDHPMNDTVDADLSPGEIVIPRSIASDPNAAKKFVEEANERDAIQSLLKVMQHLQNRSKKG